MEQLKRRDDIVRGQHVYAPNYHIILEPVYGCNRRCSFCACDFTKFHLMSDEVFSAILDNVDENTKRVSWNMCGESTLHPKLLDMISAARKHAPKALFDLTTNGDVKVIREKSFSYFDSLISAGIDFIHFDVYSEADYPLVEKLAKEHVADKYDVIPFNEGASSFWGQRGKPHVLYMGATFNENRPKSISVRFNTQAGGTPYATWKPNGVDGRSFPLKKSCKEVLKYATIGWDGKYLLCCADHSRMIDYGNVLSMSVAEFQVSRLRRMTQVALDAGRRDLVPSCYYCNKLSFRDGLWPYPWVEDFKVADLRKTLYGAARLSPKTHANFTKIKEDIGFNSADIQALYDKGASE